MNSARSTILAPSVLVILLVVAPFGLAQDAASGDDPGLQSGLKLLEVRKVLAPDDAGSRTWQHVAVSETGRYTRKLRFEPFGPVACWLFATIEDRESTLPDRLVEAEAFRGTFQLLLDRGKEDLAYLRLHLTEEFVSKDGGNWERKQPFIPRIALIGLPLTAQTRSENGSMVRSISSAGFDTTLAATYCVDEDGKEIVGIPPEQQTLLKIVGAKLAPWVVPTMELSFKPTDEKIRRGPPGYQRDPMRRKEALDYIKKANEQWRSHEFEEAIDNYKKAMRTDPEYWWPPCALAWALATCPVKGLRDPEKALDYAKNACVMSGWKEPDCFDNLAVALAANGRFTDAIEWEREYILGLARSGRGNWAVYEEAFGAEQRIELFEEKTPYEDFMDMKWALGRKPMRSDTILSPHRLLLVIGRIKSSHWRAELGSRG